MNYNKDMQIEGAKALLEADRPSGLNSDGSLELLLHSFPKQVDNHGNT